MFSYTVQDDNSLIIKKLSMDDSAMFQCLASNEAGEISSYTWLRVKSKFVSHKYFGFGIEFICMYI